VRPLLVEAIGSDGRPILAVEGPVFRFLLGLGRLISNEARVVLC
jgi:hypothetical protein